MTSIIFPNRRVWFAWALKCFFLWLNILGLLRIRCFPSLKLSSIRVFSSTSFTANSSSMYSSTLAHPNSDLSANLLCFWQSLTNLVKSLQGLGLLSRIRHLLNLCHCLLQHISHLQINWNCLMLMRLL